MFLKRIIGIAAAAMMMAVVVPSAANAADSPWPPTDQYGHPADAGGTWVYPTSGVCQDYKPAHDPVGAFGIMLGETQQVATYPNVFQGTGPVAIHGILSGLPTATKAKTRVKVNATVSLLQLGDNGHCVAKGTTQFAKIKANKNGVARMALTVKTVNIIAFNEQPCINMQLSINVNVTKIVKKKHGKKVKQRSFLIASSPEAHCFSQPLPE